MGNQHLQNGWFSIVMLVFGVVRVEMRPFLLMKISGLFQLVRDVIYVNSTSAHPYPPLPKKKCVFFVGGLDENIKKNLGGVQVPGCQALALKGSDTFDVFGASLWSEDFCQGPWKVNGASSSHHSNWSDFTAGFNKWLEQINLGTSSQFIMFKGWNSEGIMLAWYHPKNHKGGENNYTWA